ncbi:MAG: aminotransferase class I/II-fold pyridoxal phosphate-dependent enzyme [Syntrophomonadaceae bacterium]|jgi:aminotransferase|nr:aminotransferase class I/II-fold pyridoxal phosphate-dependent enzyme [Thermoanaerobacterales bacterium]NLN20759.1 aminotransferase class I/II-fold pyridoxal phosphate-dependent enzyme [Syntrophomonadaceae bacterium]
MVTNESVGSFVAEVVQKMPPSGIRKFFDLIEKTEGVISLGVGEPDYITPNVVREACCNALEKGRTKYTSNSGVPELREEIAHYLQSRFEVQYSPEQILITVGVSEAVDLALRAITNPGDEILVGEPCYVSYAPSVSLAGGIPVLVPARAEENFKLKKKDIISHISSKTKAIMISYPNNPTGAIMERADLEEIAQIARNYDLLVISDEVYAELTYGRKHVSISTLPGMKERTLLLNGFSKAFAMTGWRLGYAAGPREIIDAMLKIHQYTMLCAPSLSQFAAVTALREGMPFIDEMVNDYDKRRRIIVQGLREMGLPCFEPQGAFYAFPCIKGTGMTSEEFCEKLLFEEKVAVVPGNAFGPSGEGYIRCCYAAAQQDIEEALERIRRFLNNHQESKAAVL